MSNKVFQQNLDDKKGPQPGGPYLIQMLFKEPVPMPDKEKMTAVMGKHIGATECFCYDKKMAGFATLDHIAEFQDGKCPVQLMVMKCDKFKGKGFDAFLLSLIDAIKQRNETLQRTMEAIIYLQRDFFLTGDEATLHPMILKDVAERAGYDISTISRVSNSKYVQTNFGIYPLKYFFSESMQTDTGEEISTREVKKIMKEHVDAEDKRKPLTDEELATILKEKGYVIARRTVAKYREQLGIPVARLRKEI